MKQLHVLIFLGLAAICAAQQNPDEEIPNFNLEDFYVQPKFTMSVGVRTLSMPGATFSGVPGVVGVVAGVLQYGPMGAYGIIRNYQDGYVAHDTRNGDLWVGLNSIDHLTNYWVTSNSSQVDLTAQTVSFHAYSADIIDATTHHGSDPGNSFGTELSVARDMGNLGKKFSWKLFAGFSMNGINSKSSDLSVPANFMTLTDTYKLPPPNTSNTVNVLDIFYNQNVTYTSPTVNPYPGLTSSTSVIDVWTDGVTSIPYLTVGAHSGATTITDFFYNTPTDASVLIGQAPNNRVVTYAPGTVALAWQLKGSALTFRGGPELYYNLTDNLHLSLSVGPAMTYVSTWYIVNESFQPASGSAIATTIAEIAGRSLMGYYADATVEYSLNERAGVYLGASYQSSGVYDQSLADQGLNYSSRLDMSSMQGIRGGLNFKF